MHISPAGARLIAGFEGFSSRPYWDAYGHVWTRGFGETEGITSRSPAISRAQGEVRLRLLVEQRYEWAIRALGRSFTQNQWDALCSFLWNLGAGILEGRLGAMLKRHEDTAFANAILAYDHAGGVELLGLRRRREAERALFLRPGPGHANPLGVLREDERHNVERFDALRIHSWRHPIAFRKVSGWIRTRRKAIWYAAHGPGGWAANHRAERYRVLRSRVWG